MERKDMWAHRLAVLVAGATAALIFVGGVVTTTGSGLAVPDWPTTFGQNMFLYPPSQWVGGVLYEHSHRLVGSLVGLLTIALAVALWRARPGGGLLRWLGLAAVGGVIVQGILGGLRVVLLRQTLAMVHGVVAHGFFALVVGLAVATSPGWRAAGGAPEPSPSARVRRLAMVTTVTLYLQIALGALATHAGLLVPAHLAVGGGAAILVLWLAGRVLADHGDRPWLARPTRLMAVLLLVQLFLGLGAYLGRFTALAFRFPLPLALAFPILHRVVAALLLAASLVLMLRAYRLGRWGGAAPDSSRVDPGRRPAGALSGEVAA